MAGQPGTEARVTPACSWYLAENHAKHVRQVVVMLPPEARVPARVENLVSAGPIMAAPWAADVLWMGSARAPEGPFVFARAASVVEELEGWPVTVAFAFYRLALGGVFQVFSRSARRT